MPFEVDSVKAIIRSLGAKVSFFKWTNRFNSKVLMVDPKIADSYFFVWSVKRSVGQTSRYFFITLWSQCFAFSSSSPCSGQKANFFCAPFFSQFFISKLLNSSECRKIMLPCSC